MLWNSGDCSKAVNCPSVVEKWIERRPESEAIEVALNACFSVSDPLILRSITAAVSSEETVAAVNESPVEMVKSNLTPCWKFIEYQEACRSCCTIPNYHSEPGQPSNLPIPGAA